MQAEGEDPTLAEGDYPTRLRRVIKVGPVIWPFDHPFKGDLVTL